MDATQERWRPVVGYEGSYEVSDRGRVRSLKRVAARIIKPFLVPPTGYRYVHLWGDGQRFSKGIHVLVLEAFVEPRVAGKVACHNDGNPANNSVDNLRWDTQSENNRDIVRHGRNQNTNKTHCQRGHPLSGDNLYLNPASGGRVCRQCIRDQRGVRTPHGPRDVTKGSS